MPDDDRFAGMADALEGGGDSDDTKASASRSMSKTDQRPDAPPEAVSDTSSFQATLRERLAAVEDGDLSKNATAYDGELAALLAALEDDPDRMEAVAGHLADALGRDGVAAKKSTILSAAARLGLQAADRDLMEQLLDVRAERARQL